MDFAGWELPVYYRSLNEEVVAVRSAAGMFDVCHMGEFEVRGAGAAATVQNLLTNDVLKVPVGGSIYSPMCQEKGGTVDDLIAMRVTHENWFFVVNASRTSHDFAWISSHLQAATEVVDVSDQNALIAVQGPESGARIQELTDVDLKTLRRNEWASGVFCGFPVRMSRTGYTGEDGLELFLRPADSQAVWKALGERAGVVPCGLGARDVLRLEAGLCLYGHELREDITPLEAGLGWTVKLTKESFLGKEALRQQTEEGPQRQLIGLEMKERAIPREGCEVVREGVVVGVVSSGTYSLTQGKGIALAFVRPDLCAPGTQLEIVIRNSPKPANVVRLPFVPHGY